MIRIKCNEIEADLIIQALMSAPDCPGTWKCNGRRCEECIKDHIEFETNSCFKQIPEPYKAETEGEEDEL